ncbi:MAG: MotA/TolQ/ExbB proton channel family protein [Nitrospinaceae bacterium]|nr:MotA/TolQ/ExbB proton channel family protein [Nitrospinaceae bacterium]MBT3434563.1 MotA/TolQ/ExbB proton channel family protein [Nitrospinaceae bacterium]MBT3823026.1 MotA/TolQ/ExbB proton channel family protein [Nitrospinaceae bacterium]MBT4095624.1 MotA/TolQ/ExbB proton channel family protein [Nitrospinaceae bacterium]MBT5369981.1 MotA/TolQ/ExbB proton channel family protein [Nitrospinaceae bacterium]
MSRRFFILLAIAVAIFAAGWAVAATVGETLSGASVGGVKPVFSAGLWNLLKKGGYSMIPIGLCSVISVAVVFERIISLKRDKVMPDELVSALENHLTRSDYDESVRLCERYEVPFARIMRASLSRRHLGVGEMERAMVGTGQHEATVLSRNLRTLGVIANLSPMLGLFGTVIGMIRAFDVISQYGTGNPGLVAGGISEALLTTAAGLLVGIPSLAAYHFFKARGDRFLFEIETIAFEFLHIITVQSGQDGSARRPTIRPADRSASVSEPDPEPGEGDG